MPKPKTDKPNKVVDVADPSKVSPDTGSRPIIVTRRPMVQDPMLHDKPKVVPGPPEVSVTKVSRTAKTRLAPLSKTDNDETQAPEPEHKPADEIQPDTPKTENKDQENEAKEEAPEAAAEPAKEAEEQKPTEPDDTSTTDADEQPKPDVYEQDGLVDEFAKQAAEKKQKQQEDNKFNAQQEKVSKLVAEKTYFVPIGRATRKRNMRRLLVFLLLLLILGVAGGNFALDAGVVQTDIQPLTDLIPDQK